MDEIKTKDFIETADGLVFAVVVDGFEHGKILCFLRYRRDREGWQKFNTRQANAFLAEHKPEFLYFSQERQAHCHALTATDCIVHYQPRKKWFELNRQVEPCDEIEQDRKALHRLFQHAAFPESELGITGSVLIGAQNPCSDLDLVIYQRPLFQRARTLIQHWINTGSCQALSEQDWRDSYDRRGTDQPFEDYVWHEARKFNKAMIQGRKFDISLVAETEPPESKSPGHKMGRIQTRLKVTNDTYSFDSPAVFQVEHPQIQTVISYTATFNGQAKTGESIEVAGTLEQTDSGYQRIIIGADREALGDFIRVCHD